MKVVNTKPQVDPFVFPVRHGVSVLSPGRLLNSGLRHWTSFLLDVMFLLVGNPGLQERSLPLSNCARAYHLAQILRAEATRSQVSSRSVVPESINCSLTAFPDFPDFF